MVFIIIIAILFVIVIALYNSLIYKKNKVEKAFSSIDVMLKKRYDLIPNLVETVKQYMTHEKETLLKITEWRSAAMTGGVSTAERSKLDSQIGKAMGNIMVAVENYPDLKANENFMMLQRSWNEVEEQLSAARRAFNAAVTEYNNAIEMFPSNIMASIMGYKRKEVLVIPEEERKNVNAKELFAK